MEGSRIRASELPPVRGVVARRLGHRQGLRGGRDRARPRPSRLHTVLWWVHALLALAFVAYIPYSKSMHMLADGANLLAHDRTPRSPLPAPAPDTDHAGYTQDRADFTWKELLDLDSCTKCGRCHEVCPARTAGAPLSPRDLILDLRQWVDEQSGGLTVLDRERRPTYRSTRRSADAADRRRRDQGAHAVVVHDLHGLRARPARSASSTSRRSSSCAAPSSTRAHGADPAAGAAEPRATRATRSASRRGCARGGPRSSTSAIKDARKEPVKYLWFVGDFASYDERLAKNCRGCWPAFSPTPASTSASSTRTSGTRATTCAASARRACSSCSPSTTSRPSTRRELRGDLHHRPALAERAAQRVSEARARHTRCGTTPSCWPT